MSNKKDFYDLSLSLKEESLLRKNGDIENKKEIISNSKETNEDISNLELKVIENNENLINKNLEFQVELLNLDDKIKDLETNNIEYKNIEYKNINDKIDSLDLSKNNLYEIVNDLNDSFNKNTELKNINDKIDLLDISKNNLYKIMNDLTLKFDNFINNRLDISKNNLYKEINNLNNSINEVKNFSKKKREELIFKIDELELIGINERNIIKEKILEIEKNSIDNKNSLKKKIEELQIESENERTQIKIDLNNLESLNDQNRINILNKITNIENKIKENRYIIVGGGPGGIMTAYILATNNPKNKILLLEKNNKTINDYINKDYDDVFNWYNSMNDSEFQYSFNSNDNSTVWVGKGLGGGTLHFGLQYIDSDDIINNFNKDWYQDFQEVSNIVNPGKYDYDNFNKNYIELRNKIDSLSESLNLKFYNNKIYKNMETKKRILLGDLIINLSNIEIKYDIDIEKINFENNKVISIVDKNNNLYQADKYILSTGAIKTPIILQRSGIGDYNLLKKNNINLVKNLPDVGKNLYDHVGFTLIYGKVEITTNEVKKIVPYQGDKNFKLNLENIKILNDISKRLILIAEGRNVSTNDKGYVFDFTEWINSHPGGSRAILKWEDDDKSYTLQYPNWHSSSRWNLNKNRFTKIGKKDSIINYDDLPTNLKSEELFNNLFKDEEIVETKVNTELKNLGFETDKIIAHVQTRDKNLKWQTYYSIVPNQNNFLILTHSLLTELSKGNIEIDNETFNVNLNHIDSENKDKFLNYLFDAFKKNHNILKSLGYNLINPVSENLVDLEYIENNLDSIYHYHGTCKIGSVLDKSQKVIDIDNLYVADASVFDKPWGGSTSVPSMVAGYRCAKKILS